MRLTSLINLGQIKSSQINVNAGRFITRVMGLFGLFFYPVTMLAKRLAFVTNAEREYFYTLLGESVKSNVGFFVIFDQIESDSDGGRLATLARVARRGLIAPKGDFTTYLSESGLLPQADIELLQIGVARDSIPEICSFLVEQNTKTISFDGYFLKKASSWLASIPLAMLSVGYFGGVFRSMRSAGGEDQHIFFYVYDWTLAYWPASLVIVVWLVGLHRFAQPNLRRGRSVFYRFYIFKLYDMEWELRLTRLCSMLVPTGLSNVELLSQLARVARPNHRLYVRIVRAQRSSSEQDVIELLPFFLSGGTVAKVKAKCPDRTPSTIGEGFKMASRINELTLEKEIKAATNVLTMVLMIITMVFFGPLIAISSGF